MSYFIIKEMRPATLYLKVAGSNIARRLAKGSMWSLLGSIVSRVSILLSMIMLARILGKNSFGEFALVQSTLGVAGLMAGLGLGSTATRFTAQFTHADYDRAGKTIGLITITSAATILSTSFVLISASAPIANSLLHHADLKYALMCGTVLMAAGAFAGIQNGVLAGLERFDLIARLNILEGVLSASGLVALSLLAGLEGALLGLALGSIVSCIVGRLMLKQELASRSVRITYKGCFADWRVFANYSVPIFLSSVIGTPVLWFTLTSLANSVYGFEGVALYSAAYQWHGPMVFLPLVLASVSTPILVQEWTARRFARFRSVVFGVCGLVASLSFIPVLVCSIVASTIMGLYGPDFQAGWLVLVTLLVAAPIHAISKVLTGALLGMNRPWVVLLLNLLWAAVLVSLARLLISRLGPLGVSSAFLAAYIILSVSAFAVVWTGSRLRGSKSTSSAMEESGNAGE